MRGSRTQAVLGFIAANVRRLRKTRGWTQEILAERVDVDVTYLQRIERGKVNLSVDILVALAEALSVAPSRLLRRAALANPQRGRPRKRKTLQKPE